MKDKLFERLMRSAAEAVEHAEGKRRDLRTVRLPKPPQKLSAREIAKLRSKLNVSQAVFAKHLNISVKTVQSWEQGIGHPSGASLKLLTIVKNDPSVLLDT
jgi:putative transcriptional regulator